MNKLFLMFSILATAVLNFSYINATEINNEVHDSSINIIDKNINTIKDNINIIEMTKDTAKTVIKDITKSNIDDNNLGLFIINQLFDNGYNLKLFVNQTNNNTFVNVSKNGIKLTTYPINLQKIDYDKYSTKYNWFKYLSESEKFTDAHHINEYSCAIFKPYSNEHNLLIELTKILLGIHPNSSKNIKFFKAVKELRKNINGIKVRLLGTNIGNNTVKFSSLRFYKGKYNLIQFPLLTINDKDAKQANFKEEINKAIDAILNTPEGIKLFYELISLAMLGYNSETINIYNDSTSHILYNGVGIVLDCEVLHIEYLDSKNSNYFAFQKHKNVNCDLLHELIHFIQTPYICMKIIDNFNKKIKSNKHITPNYEKLTFNNKKYDSLELLNKRYEKYEKYNSLKLLNEKYKSYNSLRLLFENIYNFYEPYTENIDDIEIESFVKCLFKEVSLFQTKIPYFQKLASGRYSPNMWLNGLTEFLCICGGGYESYNTMQNGNNSFICENNFNIQFNEFVKSTYKLRFSHFGDIVNEVLFTPESANAFLQIAKDYANYDPNKKMVPHKYFDFSNPNNYENGWGRKINIPGSDMANLLRNSFFTYSNSKSDLYYSSDSAIEADENNRIDRNEFIMKNDLLNTKFSNFKLSSSNWLDFNAAIIQSVIH